MPTLIEAKLGEHRGKVRIYLEGSKLSREGFNPGTRYSRTIDSKQGKIVLRVVENGEYVVSKKQSGEIQKPVIDMACEELKDLVGASGRVRILVANSCLIMLRHFNDDRVIERTNLLLKELDHGCLSTASLFHGGGVASKAMHQGLLQAGIDSRVMLAIEVEGAYLESSLSNNPELWCSGSLVMNCGVESVRYHKSGIPAVSLLEAGIPCTGGAPGKAKLGLSHAEDHPTAGAAFHYTLQAVDATNPSIILFENVATYADTASCSVIRAVLGNLGYSMQEVVLNGTDFGALENRKRWFMLALSAGLEEFINVNDVVKFHQASTLKIGDILDSEVSDSVWSEYSYLRDKEQRDIAAGKGFRMQILTKDSDTCPVIVRNYAKVQSTGALLSKEDGSNLLRLLSPTEHAKIKTVPFSVVNGLSATIAHQILGQGVIFNVVRSLGTLIGEGIQAFHAQSKSRKAAA